MAFLKLITRVILISVFLVSYAYELPSSIEFTLGLSSDQAYQHLFSSNLNDHPEESTRSKKLITPFQSLDADSQDCSDPCHEGQCHFGHCSFHLTTKFEIDYNMPLRLTVNELTKVLLYPPNLDGLRRPPRA